MSKKAKEELKAAIKEAEVAELDEERLEDVAGGTCDESCRSGCSKCCSTGTANRSVNGIDGSGVREAV